MWVDYRGTLSTVYNNEEILTCGGLQSSTTVGYRHDGSFVDKTVVNSSSHSPSLILCLDKTGKHAHNDRHQLMAISSHGRHQSKRLVEECRKNALGGPRVGVGCVGRARPLGHVVRSSSVSLHIKLLKYDNNSMIGPMGSLHTHTQ